MELDWLETFLAVVDSGSFTGAAGRVHRSQSRVSAHIAALERELGVPLIDRQRRPAAATEAGALLITRARQILDDVESARVAVGGRSAPSSRPVVLRTAPGPAAAFVPAVLRRLVERHPDATVIVRESVGDADAACPEPADQLVVAVLPTAVLPTAVERPSFGRHPLWRERLRLLVPAGHELARSGGPVRRAQLAEHPLVLGLSCGLPESAMLGLLADRRDGSRAGPTSRHPSLDGRPDRLRPRARVDTPLTVAGVVRAGVGIGVAGAVGLATLTGEATDGLEVLDIESGDDDAPAFEVAAHWPDTLLDDPIGPALHEAVLAVAPPDGAESPTTNEVRPVAG